MSETLFKEVRYTLGGLVNNAGATANLANAVNGAITNSGAITLTGSMDLELQRMGAAVSRTISTPGGDVTLNFGSTDVTRLSGTLTMDAAGFARTGFRNLSAGIVAIHTGYKV